MTGQEYCQASRGRKLLRTHRKHLFDHGPHLQHGHKLFVFQRQTLECTADRKLELSEDPTSRMEARIWLVVIALQIAFRCYRAALQCMNGNLLASRNAYLGRQLRPKDPGQKPFFKQQL